MKNRISEISLQEGRGKDEDEDRRRFCRGGGEEERGGVEGKFSGTF